MELKYLNREDSIALIKKYEVPEYFINHSIEIEKTATSLANKLPIKLNLDFLKCIALLHDIGSYKICKEKGYPSEKRGLHAPEGQILLEKLGYHELAKCIGAHFILDVNEEEAKQLDWPITVKLPNLIEGKVFVIADILHGKSNIHSALKECIDNPEMEIKYWNKCPQLKEKTRYKFLEIIKELESYGWDGTLN